MLRSPKPIIFLGYVNFRRCIQCGGSPDWMAIKLYHSKPPPEKTVKNRANVLVRPVNITFQDRKK